MMCDQAMSGRLSLSRLADVMSRGPARLLGLADRKGSLQVGRDGDITVVDTDATWTIRASELESKAGWSPFEGRVLSCRVATTILRGRTIHHRGEIVAEPGVGAFLSPSQDLFEHMAG
jgi:dihydroorotase-like cyclic amidohydrolase